MKDYYIKQIVKLLSNESITVVKAIYKALISIFDKKWINRGIFLQFNILQSNYSQFILEGDYGG